MVHGVRATSSFSSFILHAISHHFAVDHIISYRRIATAYNHGRNNRSDGGETKFASSARTGASATPGNYGTVGRSRRLPSFIIHHSTLRVGLSYRLADSIHSMTLEYRMPVKHWSSRKCKINLQKEKMAELV
jgi:hypothetical protein